MAAAFVIRGRGRRTPIAFRSWLRTMWRSGPERYVLGLAVLAWLVLVGHAVLSSGLLVRHNSMMSAMPGHEMSSHVMPAGSMPGMTNADNAAGGASRAGWMFG